MLHRSESTPVVPENSGLLFYKELSWTHFLFNALALIFHRLNQGCLTCQFVSFYCIILPFTSLRNIHSSGLNQSISFKKKFKIISTTREPEVAVVTASLLALSLVTMRCNCKQNGDN
jgi:hypothetical protein